MRAAPLPPDEVERLEEVFSTGLLDTPAEAAFDELTELAATIVGCPLALISLVERDRQWFKAKKGWTIDSTSRELSFCAHVVYDAQPLIVEDTTQDERFCDHPAVTGPEHIRFYAGMPLRSENGKILGTVCVQDRMPRTLTPDQEKALDLVACQAAHLISLRQKANIASVWTRQKLALERATIQYRIRQQEEEREMIGDELRENFAALVYECICLLASNDEAAPERASELLTALHLEINKLAAIMMPLDEPGGSLEAFRSLIHDFQDAGRVQVSFTQQGNLEDAHPRQLLTLFRVLTEQLYAYEQQEKTQPNLAVDIRVGNELELRITTRNNHTFLESEERRIVANDILNRCLMANGGAEVTFDAGYNRTLHVRLPLK